MVVVVVCDSGGGGWWQVGSGVLAEVEVEEAVAAIVARESTARVI
jgi:N-methylhydantoinase B/oxoprolinase/acetone carboxylase alpha subunit